MRRIPIRVNKVKSGTTAELVILCESPLVSNPKQNMDKAVAEENSIYVYEDEFLDNPWIRLVIHGIENLNYKFCKRTGIASAVCQLERKKRNAMLYVLFANPQIENPIPVLEDEVLQLTAGKSYNAFTDCSRKNPWVKVVVVGLNEILGSDW